MNEINCVILFDGTTEDIKQPNVTNVVKLFKGLVRDPRQIVIYENGIGNALEWRWSLFRLFADMTGYGGGWVMQRAFHSLTKELNNAIRNNTLKEGDILKISVGGFSRGAALARQFVNSYLKSTLQTKLPIRVKVKIDAEYLFDTVPSFGLPLHIRLAAWLGIKLENWGWDFSVADEIKSYHAVSLDEKRWAFKPHLVEYLKGKREEIWFAGDHGSVGGGYPMPYEGAVMGDHIPLQFIAKSAHQNGLSFTPEFIKNVIHCKKKESNGFIATPAWYILPEYQRCDRKPHVIVHAEKHSNLKPYIHQSVIERVQTTSYCPSFLHVLKRFKVIDTEGNIKKYKEEQISDLLKQHESNGESLPQSKESIKHHLW